MQPLFHAGSLYEVQFLQLWDYILCLSHTIPVCNAMKTSFYLKGNIWQLWSVRRIFLWLTVVIDSFSEVVYLLNIPSLLLDQGSRATSSNIKCSVSSLLAELPWINNVRLEEIHLFDWLIDQFNWLDWFTVMTDWFDQLINLIDFINWLIWLTWLIKLAWLDLGVKKIPVVPVSYRKLFFQ
jgi:hypothetical protein